MQGKAGWVISVHPCCPTLYNRPPHCRWFNSTFLISALLSVLLFYGLLRQKRQEASDRLPVYMAPSEKELSRSW